MNAWRIGLQESSIVQPFNVIGTRYALVPGSGESKTRRGTPPSSKLSMVVFSCRFRVNCPILTDLAAQFKDLMYTSKIQKTSDKDSHKREVIAVE